MIIQGTEKIRGCMVISNPKLELKKLQTIRLSDDDYNKADLRTAIDAGYVRILEGPGASKMQKIAASTPEYIQCRNELNRPLAMNLFPRGIAPQEEFVVTTVQLSDPELKEAIDRGYVKVLKDLKKESTINLQQLASKVQQNTHQSILDTNEEISTPTETIETKKKKIKEATIFIPTEPPAAPRIATKEEEPSRRNINLGDHVIDSPDPKPVQANDVPRRKSIIWNPSNNPIPFNKKVITGQSVNEQSVNEQSVNEQSVNEQSVNEQDISFVDQEQESQRHASHPVLGKKPLERQDSVQFVDQIQEEQRINAHPVLKNKQRSPSDACDIDFV